MKLKTAAVIGVGSMGKNHVRIYSELPRVKLIGVVDNNYETALEMGTKYKVPYFTKYEDLYEKLHPDVVSIVVPTKYHFAVASYFLSKNVDVLLEKPICLNLQEAKKLITIAEKSNAFFTIGHIERFNPAVRVVKKLIKAKRIGDILTINAKRIGLLTRKTTENDVLLDIGIHDIDIANYLMESYPIAVTTYKNTLNGTSVASAEMLLKYKQGSAIIQANWLTPVKIRELSVVGTRGYITLDYIHQKVSLYEQPKIHKKQQGDFVSMLLLEPTKLDVPVKKQEPLKEEMISFLKHAKYSQNAYYATKALEIALHKASL